MENWLMHACLWLGFSSALVAGVFQSFSDFVMAGLVRASPPAGIQTMQQINKTVFRSVFLTLFLALVPLTLGLAAYVVLQGNRPAGELIIGAAATYFFTVFLVTVAANVPMNERLDRVDHRSAEAVDYWRTYGTRWTRWNHLRSLGSAVTAALLLLAAVTIAAS